MSDPKPKQKVVLVDVDGVAADLYTPWVSWYRDKYDHPEFRVDHITGWNIQEFVKPECGREIFDWLHLPGIYDSVPVIEGALEGVQAIRDMGHRVVFVTATNLHQNGQKLLWLARHGFLALDYGTHSKDYVECHSKGLIRGDVLIDDGVHNITDWEQAQTGSKSKVAAILFDQPHNRNAGMFLRGYGWKAVPGLIQEIFNHAN